MIVTFLPYSASAFECKGKNGLTINVGTPGFESLCQDAAGNAYGNSPIFSLVQGISNYIVGIIGSVAVLIIIISGIQMVTSAGNPDGIKAGKKRLVTAITSLFVLVAMRVILNLIISGGGY